MKRSLPRGASHRVARCGQPLNVVAVAGLMALAACGLSPEPLETRPDAEGWHNFHGSWTASGSRHIIPLGGERRASLFSLTGSLLLTGKSRPGVGFRSEVIALSDSATGMVGRAVWTDERGNQVYSELRGEGTAAGNRITGTFIGGSGRYAGVTGDYELAWQYVMEAEDGTVQGRAVGLKGRVRLGQAQAAPATKRMRP